MRSFYTFCISIAILATIACKSDTASQAETQHDAAASHDSSGQQTQPNATSSTPAPAGGHDYTFLTHEIFHIGGAHVTGTKDEKTEPYKDQWVDLLPDGTFKWGEHKNVLYSGKWSYNGDNKILQFNPVSGNGKQSEWKVMHNEKMVVLLGTPTFGNNNTQIQLVHSTTLPD